jgi:PKD repeat protein
MLKYSIACLVALVFTVALVSEASCYSRITIVTVRADSPVMVGEPVVVKGDIQNGNDRFESIENVRAMLILPDGAKVTSGVNPVIIGEMGPGPTVVSCRWTVVFEQAGSYNVTVNASCVDTQNMPRWLANSTSVEVYDVPAVEFAYTSNTYANQTMVFNATNSFALGSGAEIVSYEWNFGDGTNINGTDPVVEHEFSRVGNYTVSLNVTDNRGLSNVKTADLKIVLFGDINRDNAVNILDVSLVSYSYGSRLGDTRWNATCDLDVDGVVDIIDVSLVAREYGKTG